MKKNFCAVFLLLMIKSLLASNTAYAANYVIQPVIAACDMPEYAQVKLSACLARILESYGIASTNNNSRIVIAAKIFVIENNITRTNPPKVSKHIEIAMTIGDIIENTQFSSGRISIAGIGETDTKAYINAFNSVIGGNLAIKEMMTNAMLGIDEYYSDNIDRIVEKAKRVSESNDAKEAIYLLTTVPDVNDMVAQKRDDAACEILKQMTARSSYTAYINAKEQWTTDKSVESARKALGYLKEVNVTSPNYMDALTLWKDIANKLESVEKEASMLAKRDYEDAKKQYEDRMAFRRSILDACVSIGTSFGNHQPQSVTKTINKWGF